jgi:serine/threonine protein kinase
MTTPIREHLGRYQIEAEIGRGAMGVVYRARDPKIDRLVALKTISFVGRRPQEEQEYRDRFVQEARAAGRLSHPGIVTVHDAGEDPETREPFFVMEYVAGQPLSETIASAGGELAFNDALRFACEIADALQYAHERGVIHGDIKPANVLVDADGHAKIADFGVARLNQSIASQGGMIFGSPAYMAPEQLNGAETDPRSDLFSLGVILYSMITGFRPFQGNSAATVCFKVINVDPIPITSFHAELQPELDRIVSRAIAKNPSERYQSCAEMAAEIRAFGQNDSSTTDTMAFFTRVLERSTAVGSGHVPLISKRALLQAGVALALIAFALTAWELQKQYRDMAALVPPSPPAPVAPAVEKTPFPLVAIEERRPPRERIALTSKLRVEILHHFDSGKASLWLDDHLVLDQELHGDSERHPIFHVVEMNQTANLNLTSGWHNLKIRITSPDDSYDDSQSLRANLTLGTAHVLSVNCDKRKLQVRLH